MRRYLVWQFVAAAFAVLWIGNLFAQSGGEAVLLPCVLLWSTLYSFGLLSESRSYALRFELLRLFGILPLGIAGMQHLSIIGEDMASPVWIGTVIYVLISTTVLRLAAGPRDTQLLDTN